MVQDNTPTQPGDEFAITEKEQGMQAKNGTAEIVVTSSEASADNGSQNERTPLVPLRMKLISILLVTAVGFGSHWSSGVTGAMKSTLKKVSQCLNFHQISHT
jgi:hypothetical protein